MPALNDHNRWTKIRDKKTVRWTIKTSIGIAKRSGVSEEPDPSHTPSPTSSSKEPKGLTFAESFKSVLTTSAQISDDEDA